MAEPSNESVVTWLCVTIGFLLGLIIGFMAGQIVEQKLDKPMSPVHTTDHVFDPTGIYPTLGNDK